MTRFRFHLPLLAALVPLIAGIVAPAAAQTDWPKGTVKVIVPFAPGGSTDSSARPYADGLTRALGQPFVIENRAGASGAIGAEAVAKGPKDGYTVCWCAQTLFTVIPHLRQTPYKLGDLVPVALGGISGGGMVVAPGSGLKTFQDFVTLVKAQPGKLAYGTAGVGSSTHMRMENLKQTLGLDLIHVPYKGSGEAVNDVMAGNLLVTIETTIYPLAKAGRLNLLAVFAQDRRPEFPDVPTIGELGFPQLNTASWYGFFVPAGTPPAIMAKLNAETAKIAALPETKTRLDAIGFRTDAPSIADLDALLRRDNELHAKIIRDAGIKGE